jgi:nitrogen regulatory protein PII
MSEDLKLPPHRGEYRVLTCIMPAGRGAEVMELLRRELGVVSASVHHARGIGTQSLRHRVYSDEKQVLSVVVPEERADAVFEMIYFGAGLDAPHAGMVMMGRAFRAAGLEAPALAEDVQ